MTLRSRSPYSYFIPGLLVGYLLQFLTLEMEPLAAGSLDFNDRSPLGPVRIQGENIVAEISIARVLPSDQIIVPPKYRGKRVFLELGVSTIYTAKTTLMKKESFADVWILAFEPLLSKWAANLEGLDGKYNEEPPLGSYISGERGLILPIAVGPSQALLTFNVGDNSGCSSLFNVSNTDQDHVAQCSKPKEKRHVPSVTMHTVLGWLGDTDVEFTKIDIQGMDYFAVESAGDLVHKLHRIQLEVPVYQGISKEIPNCKETIKRMDSLGFRLGTAKEVGEYAPLEGAYGNALVYADGPVSCAEDPKETQKGKEYDVFFVRKDL